MLRATLLLFLITLSSFAAAPVDKFILALKPDKNPEVMRAERDALSAALAQKLGRPVETVIPLSAAVILEGFANGTIDAGYLSATDLVNARAKQVGRLLLAGQFADGRTAYDSYWVVKKDSPYQSIADLRGRPVAFASRTSTSGFALPLLDLRKRGLITDEADLDAFFGRGNVFWGSGYVSAIERVLAGEAEAAAVSYYVLDQDKHLSLEQRAKLRKLQSQGPVPSHVIAVRTSLSEADASALKAALLSFNEGDAASLRDRVFTTQLVETDETAHVASLQEALALAKKALKQ
ncbi:MAG: phosphate/phosphite/phosphonate ABC transporter substrate-binding protein [Opitutaceae bacterium]|nr:phosphate/phosphite/phosphonate ABC transporter substrate-binding protein [Opitutaceae bacterium]